MACSYRQCITGVLRKYATLTSTSFSPVTLDEKAQSATLGIPFLRSCKNECDAPIKGALTGEIPKWLKGGLLRIGSGLLEVGPDRFNHLFDGLGLMHRFSFRDGEVTYQSRFVRSDVFRKNIKTNRIVGSHFATRGIPDPCKTIFQRFSSRLSSDERTDNDAVNIILYGFEPYACTETNNIWKIHPETLESLQKVNLSKFLPIDGATAHAHEEPDGTLYNVGSKLGFSSSYKIFKIPPKKDNPFQDGSVVCTIPSSRYSKCGYHHSFGMSDNYFIFVEQPMFLSRFRMLKAHFTGGNYADALVWDENAQNRFHVVRRSDGKLLDTVYVSKSFFTFHHINAYEEDNQLVVDLCGYEEGNAISILYLKSLEQIYENPKSNAEPFVCTARRYVLPLSIPGDSATQNQNLVTMAKTEASAYRQKDGSILCNFEMLTSEPWYPELPRINYEKHNGKKYKYFYAVARNETLNRTQLIKVDVEKKTTVTWSDKGVIPSEPVFISEPGSGKKDEDSGVLLASLLYNDDETKVSMIVLDAKTMNEMGKVTFNTKSSVPGDFHGIFVAQE